MIYEERKRIAVVGAKSPAQFEAEFNQRMEELADMDPEYELRDVGGELWAVISYTETDIQIETAEDWYLASGIYYTCSACPLHEDIKDRRLKYVGCRYAPQMGETLVHGRACERFYEELRAGAIEPTEAPRTAKTSRKLLRKLEGME